jgi:hypothetical protein
MQEQIQQPRIRNSLSKGKYRSSQVFFAILLLVACLGVATWISSPPQAFAASMTTHQAMNAGPLCSGTGCNGKDPYVMHCAGQSWDSWYVVLTKPVLSQENQPIGYIQLWYSNTCKTNWTRLVVQVSHNWMQAVVGDDKWGDPVLKNTSTVTSHTAGELLSPQLYAPIAGAAARGDAVPLLDGRITTSCVDQDTGHICSWLPL